MQDAVLALLGIAKKAGKISTGAYCSERDVRAGKARLLVLAGDISEASKKKYRNLCTHYQVQVLSYGTKESLGKALGREYCASAAVLDEGLADGIRGQIANSKAGGC